MQFHFNLRRSGLRAFAVAALVAVLAACGSKPPACGDEKTIGLAKTIISDEVEAAYVQVLEALKVANPQIVKFFQAAKPDVARYRSALNVEVRNVVTNGYNAEARKHNCSGVFVVSTLTGKTFTSQHDFTSQATADGDGRFIVQIVKGQSLRAAIEGDFGEFLNTTVMQALAALGAGAATNTQQPPATPAASAVLPDGKAKYKKDDGTTEVEVVGKEVRFDIKSGRGDKTCGMDGTALMIDATRAEYHPKDKDDKCVVQLKFSDGRLEVNTDECDRNYCGMGAEGSMDGLYKR